MAHITLLLDHPEYDDPIEYTGTSMDIIELLGEPQVRLTKDDGSYTLHRYKLVEDISLA